MLELLRNKIRPGGDEARRYADLKKGKIKEHQGRLGKKLGRKAKALKKEGEDEPTPKTFAGYLGHT